MGTATHIQDLLLRPITIVLIVLVTLLAASLGARVIRRTIDQFGRRSPTARDESRSQRLVTVGRIVANAWRVAVAITGGITVLSVVGIDLAPLLAGATVVGATIGFGAQSLVRDTLSGLLMLFEDQCRIGDVVRIGDVTGSVEEVSLRITRLRDDDGTAWYIPNGQILRLGNTSRHWTRALVSFPVALSAEIPAALAAIGEVARSVTESEEIRPKCLSAPQVLGVSAVTESAMTIDVQVRTTPGSDDEVARALREAITERLAGAGMLATQPGG
jgi:moderate conductance mechanosensitive channel